MSGRIKLQLIETHTILKKIVFTQCWKLFFESQFIIRSKAWHGHPTSPADPTR